jgi:hypothetical protein
MCKNDLKNEDEGYYTINGKEYNTIDGHGKVCDDCFNSNEIDSLCKLLIERCKIDLNNEKEKTDEVIVKKSVWQHQVMTPSCM